MKLYIDQDGLDIHQAGYDAFAWGESYKDEGDIEIWVDETYVDSTPDSFGEANYSIRSDAAIKRMEEKR